MKFSVEQHQLLRAIQNVERAVPTQSTMPVLQGILVQCNEDNTIRLTANDMELGIECSIKGKISKAGSIVFPAEFFSSIIKELPSEEVSIQVEEDFTAQIICGDHIRFNVKGMDPYQFPTLQELEEVISFTLNQGSLKNQINRVKMAISNQDDVPVLAGALVEIDGETLNMVATNSFRLAFKSIPLLEKKEVVEKREIIIPGDTLKELEKLLDVDDTLQLSITERQAIFKFSNLVIISRLIEGDFPNYRMVIPDNSRLKVKVNRKSLLRSTRRVSLLSKTHHSAIRVLFKDNTMRINANDPELGSAQEELKVDLSGEDLQIAFNPSYLLDVLKVLQDKEVHIELLDPLKPCVIKTFEDEDYVYLIMPIKINESMED